MDMPDAQILGHLDAPTGWIRFAETVDVVGWTFATDASDVEVTVSLDGRTVLTFAPDVVREDVSEAFGVPQAVQSGFRRTLTRDLVSGGDVTTADEFALVVDVRSASGLTKCLGDASLEWVRAPELERARGDYRAVWDGVSRSIDDARISVAGYTDDSDIDFLAMMIPHHEGAVEMARLLLIHGGDPVTRKLAEEIIAGQQVEIEGMRRRLEQLRRGESRSKPDGFPALGGTRRPATVK